MPSNKLENLLNPSADGDLGELISRAQRMGELTELLCKLLPESDRGAIVAANVREDGELVVICASSAWASGCATKLTSCCKQPRTLASRHTLAGFGLAKD